MGNERLLRRRPAEEAVQEIVAGSGTQFRPQVVEALEGLYERGALPLSDARPTDEAA